VGARALFSNIYEIHLAKTVVKATKEWESKPPPEPVPLHVNAADPRARLAAESQMINWMKRLILCLPDERLELFLNFIYREGTKLYRTWPPDTKEAFDQRIVAMDRARSQMETAKNFPACEQSEEAGKRAATQSDIGDKIFSKEPLDILTAPPHIGGVQNEIRDLKGLIERLKKVTAPRGAKAALAREFKVSRQAVNQWLSGESNPSADLAIRLQYWKPKLPAK
jgi:hypothetical protein